MTQQKQSNTEHSVSVILRFERGERWVHWAIAVPFMICYVSAAVLFFVYNPEPMRPYRAAVAWIHRISGACLIVFPGIALITHPRTMKTHLKNIYSAWVWSFDDFKWLVMMGLSTISKRFALPESGKFNAAEKLNFMVVMTSSPLFIVTGLLIWLPQVASYYPWWAHVLLAGVVTPLMFGHIFMATVNPSTRVGLSGMVTGFVKRRWAEHHYPRWYRDNFESRERRRARTDEMVTNKLPTIDPTPGASPDDEHRAG